MFCDVQRELRFIPAAAYFMLVLTLSACIYDVVAWLHDSSVSQSLNVLYGCVRGVFVPVLHSPNICINMVAKLIT